MHGETEYGCEKYFCMKHLCIAELPNGETEYLCKECYMNFLTGDKRC